MSQTTPLSKKTKTELLEEYKQLLEKYEELKTASKLITDSQSAEIISKAEGYTVDAITSSVTNLKAGITNTLDELLAKLLAEVQRFDEMQKALELLKKSLEVHYNVQVAAETLQQLVDEYKAKNIEFEEDLTKKRRHVLREQEEYEYATNRNRRRSDEEYQEQNSRREQMLHEHEEHLKTQEAEFQNLKEQVMLFPALREKACAQREQEVAKRLQENCENRLEAEKKDWLSQKNIYEIRLKHLEEQLKTQGAEILAHKQVAENANKKVQELAIKVIEETTGISAKEEEPKKEEYRL